MALALFGCARGAAPSSGPDLTGSGPIDLAAADAPPAADLRATDGSVTDLAVADGTAGDLAGADLARPGGVDLGGTGGIDLAAADLVSSPADLTPAPDLARPPCVLLPQSGCGTGQKCTVGAGGGNVCQASGTRTAGQSCFGAGTDDCVAGDLCTSDAPAPAPPICRAFCGMDADCTQPAVPSGTTPEPNNVARCLISITGSSAKVCTFACNPVSAAGASGCTSGQECTYGVASGGVEVTDCAVAGPAGNVDNFNCAKASDCAPGFTCVGPSGMSRCRQMCRGPQTPHTTNTDCANAFHDCWAPAGVTTPMFGFCCDFINGC